MVNFTAAKQAWDNNVFGYFSKTLTRVPVTRVIDNITGSEILQEGTPDTAYKAVFFRREDQWKMDNPGLFQDSDAVMLVQTTGTINKDDKITFDSQNYRVKSIATRYLGGTAFYIVAQLFRT